MEELETRIMASWWNGRHAGLKNRSPSRGVKVRILLGLPFLMLSCSHWPLVPGTTETYLNGCESIDVTPDDNEEWSAFCYCTGTNESFGQCIDDWADWNKHQ